MNQTQTITFYQPFLQRIAMRMVGSFQDAEDIVQDTFVNWLVIDQQKIVNTKAYLVRSVTNSCINHLQTLKRKKNKCLDAINPSELMERCDWSYLDIEHELSAAFAVINKKLEPVEKAVYLLREVFNFDYEELQEIVNKKKDNCRQLFSRAKEKLSLDIHRKDSEICNFESLFDSFMKACSLGEATQLIENLKLEIAKKDSF